MQRFFISSRNISHDQAIIEDKKQIHYLKNVLRLKPDTAITIFDENGNEYLCRILSFSGKTALEIKKKLSPFRKKNSFKVTIACAIPKNSKMDDIIDKLTQLGVDRIIPLLTKRTIVNLNDKKKETKFMRWQKVIISASQQSQRKTLPILGPITDIQKVLSKTGEFDLKLIPTLLGKRKSLKEIMGKVKYKNILILIGPEGDFSSHEVDLAKRAGCIPVSLGDLVLRVETAAIAAVSFIRLYANH